MCKTVLLLITRTETIQNIMFSSIDFLYILSYISVLDNNESNWTANDEKSHAFFLLRK